MLSVTAQFRKFIDHFSPGRHGLWKILFLIGTYSFAVCWVDDHGFPAKKVLDADAALSISAVIGLLLIFRNNSAYDRWWEARKLWGQLVNESRNLCIKVRSYVDLPESERRQFAQLIAGFATALRDHLRGKRDPARLAAIGIEDHHQHVPMMIALKLYGKLKEWREAGLVDHWEQMQIDVHAKTLMDVCGATERILKSPIAGSYKLLLWLGLVLNIFFLPWLLVPVLDWWTPPVILISSYFVFALEMLAEEVERPFDELPNDLPLDTICENIRLSAEEVMNTPS